MSHNEIYRDYFRRIFFQGFYPIDPLFKQVTENLSTQEAHNFLIWLQDFMNDEEMMGINYYRILFSDDLWYRKKYGQGSDFPFEPEYKDHNERTQYDEFLFESHIRDYDRYRRIEIPQKIKYLKKQLKELPNSFNFLGTTDQLEVLHMALVREQFIAEDTHINDFKSIFNAERIEGDFIQIKWIDISSKKIRTTRSLFDLLYLLNDKGLLPDEEFIVDKNKFSFLERIAGCFSDGVGASLNKGTLRNQNSKNYLIGSLNHSEKFDLIKEIVDSIS